jgi:hypothetical protein
MFSQESVRQELIDGELAVAEDKEAFPSLEELETALSHVKVELLQRAKLLGARLATSVKSEDVLCIARDIENVSRQIELFNQLAVNVRTKSQIYYHLLIDIKHGTNYIIPTREDFQTLSWYLPPVPTKRRFPALQILTPLV